MKHPDTFAAAAAFSAAIYTDDQIIAKSWERVEAVMYGAGLSGEDRLHDHYKRNSPVNLASSLDVESLKKVRWYIDCGDGDIFFKGNATLHIIFSERKIPHEYRVRDGVHSWSYWRDGLIPALSFIGTSFRR